MPCDHCWHLFLGTLWMVVKPGHVVQSCCKCPKIRQVHRDHLQDSDQENH